MKQVIENIRQKPLHQQNRIIYGILLGVTIALIIVWIIIGIPGQSNPKSDGDLINQVNQNYNTNKGMLPDLFPKN